MYKKPIYLTLLFVLLTPIALPAYYVGDFKTALRTDGSFVRPSRRSVVKQVEERMRIREEFQANINFYPQQDRRTSPYLRNPRTIRADDLEGRRGEIQLPKRVTSRAANGSVKKRRFVELDYNDPNNLNTVRGIPEYAETKEVVHNTVNDDFFKVTVWDHIRGDHNADIALIELTDLECPFCQNFHPTLKRLLADYDGQVQWVYRPMPLEFHPNALPAAMGAECAYEQGQDDALWSFIDMVIEQGVEQQKYTLYARNLELDEEQFSRCLSSERYKTLVELETRRAKEAGISGTPTTIVVNTRTNEYEIVQGAQSIEVMKTVIDSLLE